MKRWLAMLVVVALGILPGLTGCKLIEKDEAKNTEDILAAAGFRQFPANTPAHITMLQTMKPRTMKMINHNGKAYYVYPDPTNCNCLYAGTVAEYEQYKKLAFEKEMADEKLEAAEAAEDASMNWGMWGPWW